MEVLEDKSEWEVTPFEIADFIPVLRALEYCGTPFEVELMDTRIRDDDPSLPEKITDIRVLMTVPNSRDELRSVALHTVRVKS